jgi:hypothetical protein
MFSTFYSRVRSKKRRERGSVIRREKCQLLAISFPACNNDFSPAIEDNKVALILNVATGVLARAPCTFLRL